jgi:hypothetical protein
MQKQRLNKEWLEAQYVVEQRTPKQIAELVGCSKNTIINHLRRYGIPVRSSPESKKLNYKPHSRLYEVLNDQELLYAEYVVQGLSIKKIARKYGIVQHNSVRQALIRHGIKIRTISDGLTNRRYGDNFVFNADIINGGLLGDASFKVWNKHSDNSYPTFVRKNKYRDHVEWVAELLCGQRGIARVREYCKCVDGKTFRAYIFKTLTHKSLRPLYCKWYPESNGFKKIVPPDIEINKTILLHWFLDDGYVSKRDCYILFCSESFVKGDQEMLCEKMNKAYCLSSRVVRCNSGTGWRICIPRSQTQSFFEIIGPAPILSLAYKWASQ